MSETKITENELDNTPGSLAGVWKDWTPTFTNISGGSITFAKYTKIGKTVHFKFKYTLAGAGVSGNGSFTLPLTAASTMASSPIGIVSFDNSGVTSYLGYIVPKTTADAYIYVGKSDGTYPQITALSATVGHTWKSGDSIQATGSYEVA